MQPDELISRIRAALNETERIAQAADVGRWEVGPAFGALDNRVYVRREGDLFDSVGTCVIAGQVSNVPRWRGNAGHIAHHDPDAVLRQVAAMREIVDEHYIIERKVNWTDDEGEDRQTHLPVCVVCVPKYSSFNSREQAIGPCKTVRALARGLGINPQEETE